MMVRSCDCCYSTRSVLPYEMTRDGIEKVTALVKINGNEAGVDLCESCAVSLRFHWGECKKRGAK